jgi:hypothetical protein
MQTNRETWPTECMQGANNFYYNQKLSNKGRVEISLHTDYQCIYEYTGDMTVKEVVTTFSQTGNNNQSSGSSSLEEELTAWNDAFNAFKICQLCKSLNLTLMFGYTEENTGFVYQDATEYKNVNQCMKFQMQTTMLTASYKNLMLAES